MEEKDIEKTNATKKTSSTGKTTAKKTAAKSKAVTKKVEEEKLILDEETATIDTKVEETTKEVEPEQRTEEVEGPAILDLDEKTTDEILSEEPEGVYTKKESDIQKNFVYKTPTGKVDNRNVFLADTIEGARTKFLKSYKSNKLGGTISVALFATFLVATAIIYLLLSQSENKALYNGLIWPFLSLSIVSLICFIFLSSRGTKKSREEIQNYLDTWSDSFVSAAYCGREGVENISYSVEGKVDDWSVINTHYFATIDSIDSRCHVVMDYLGKAYCDTEVSITVPLYSDFAKRIASEKVISSSSKNEEETTDADVDDQPKKDKKVETRQRSPYVGGYGKFISYSLKAKGDNDHLLITRETKESYLPTNVHGLTRFDNLAEKYFGEGYVIWANDAKFVEEVLSDDVIAQLEALEINNVLEDWFFTFNKKGAAFMLNYGKAIMELPMYEKVHADEVEKYPNDISHVLSTFKILSKKFD